MPNDDSYLTPQQLVERYKGVVTLRTLANWRSNKEGPAYTKIGGKVLYALSAVANWEMKRTIKVIVLMAGVGLTEVI